MATEQLPEASSAKPRRKGGRVKSFFVGLIIGMLLLGALFVLGTSGAFGSIFPQFKAAEPQITTQEIESKLEEAGELTTAKLMYSAVEEYKEGSIPIINKSKFAMFYQATVRAGIDVKNVKQDLTDDTLTLTLPPAKILEVTIHSDSLQFYNREKGLFSTDGAKQVKKALVEAEKRARDADMSDLLDMADEQLEKVMKGIFEDSIGDRVLVIKRTPRTDPTPGDAEISSDMDNA